MFFVLDDQVVMLLYLLAATRKPWAEVGPDGLPERGVGGHGLDAG
jgi:hypothetical protein